MADAVEFHLRPLLAFAACRGAVAALTGGARYVLGPRDPASRLGRLHAAAGTAAQLLVGLALRRQAGGASLPILFPSFAKGEIMPRRLGILDLGEIDVMQRMVQGMDFEIIRQTVGHDLVWL